MCSAYSLFLVARGQSQLGRFHTLQSCTLLTLSPNLQKVVHGRVFGVQITFPHFIFDHSLLRQPCGHDIMASLLKTVAAPVAQKVAHSEMEKQKTINQDYHPIYEYQIINGKRKRVKKGIPSYIPEHDAVILKKVRKWAHRLDTRMSINLCFFKRHYGLSFWIGLIPEIGDLINLFISCWLCAQARKVKPGLGAKRTCFVMIWVLAGTFVGLVPLLGDLADACMMGNKNIARHLEERLDDVYNPNSKRNKNLGGQGMKTVPSQLPPYDRDPEKGATYHQAKLPSIPPPTYNYLPNIPRSFSGTTVPLRLKTPPSVPLSSSRNERRFGPDSSLKTLQQPEHPPAPEPQQTPSRFGRYAGDVLEIAKPYAKPAAQSALHYAQTRHEKQKAKPMPTQPHGGFI